MANAQDKARKDRKSEAIVKRLEEIHQSRELLIGMLDEVKLDMLILALGIGSVELPAPIDFTGLDAALNELRKPVDEVRE
jgi:hypothetical protein